MRKLKEYLAKPWLCREDFYDPNRLLRFMRDASVEYKKKPGLLEKILGCTEHMHWIDGVFLLRLLKNTNPSHFINKLIYLPIYKKFILPEYGKRVLLGCK